MALTMSVDSTQMPAVLAIGGELDMTTMPELVDAAGALIDGGHRRLVLDLGGLTFCDSAGLSAFARLARRLTALDGLLVLARPTSIVESVLQVTGMAKVIPTYPSVAEARAAART